MIIYGLKVRYSRRGAGAFRCPNCQTQQRYQASSMRRWFTLYFIPIIPLNSLGEQVECQGCFSRYEPGVLSQSAQMPNVDGDPVPLSAMIQSSPVINTQNALQRPESTSGLAITSLIRAVVDGRQFPHSL